MLAIWHVGNPAFGKNRVHQHGITICSIIINELTEGRVELKQARRLATAIASAANKHFGRVTCGEMWLFLSIVHVESGFKTDVVNHKNCWGMFQVHAPSWARKFGYKYRQLRNPEVNADAGVRVFKYYLDRYKKLDQALSAYNSDHPHAARGYVLAVLGTKRRIKKRYTQLYLTFRKLDTMGFCSNTGSEKAPGIRETALLSDRAASCGISGARLRDSASGGAGSRGSFTLTSRHYRRGAVRRDPVQFSSIARDVMFGRGI
jgi:hypothetical protein